MAKTVVATVEAIPVIAIRGVPMTIRTVVPGMAGRRVMSVSRVSGVP